MPNLDLSMVEGRQSKIEAALRAVRDVDPDQASRVLPEGDRRGLKPLAALNMADALDPGLTLDYDRLSKKTPVTFDFMREPERAALAKDDVDSLAEIERRVRMLRMLKRRDNSSDSGWLIELDRTLREWTKPLTDLLPEWMQKDITSAGSGASRVVGGVVDMFTQADSGLGNQIAQMVQDRNYGEQSWHEKIAGAFGSMVPLVLAVLGAKVLGASTLVGSGVAIGLESASEGGSVMRQALDRGATPDNALDAGLSAMFANLPVNAVLNVFGGTSGRFAKRLLFDAGKEGGQEAVQGLISDVAVEYGVDPESLTWEQFTNALTSPARLSEFAIGALVGGGTGAAMDLIKARDKSASMDLSFLAQILARGEEASKLAGRSPEQYEAFLGEVLAQSGIPEEVAANAQGVATLYQQAIEAEGADLLAINEALEDAGLNLEDLQSAVDLDETIRIPTTKIGRLAQALPGVETLFQSEVESREVVDNFVKELTGANLPLPQVEMESWARQAVAAGASPKEAAGAALIAGHWARTMSRYLGISPSEYWNKHLAGVVGPGSMDYAAGSMHVLGQAAMRRSEKPFEKFHEDALNEANSHQEFWDYGESPLLGLPVKVGEDRIRKSRSRHPDVTMEDWQRLPEIISGASEMHELPSKGRQWPVGSKAFICHEKGKSWVVIGAPRKKRGGYFEVLSLFSNNRDAASNWLKQAGQNKKVLAGVGGGPNRAQAQDAKILGRTSPGGPSAKKITNLFASYKKKPNFDLDPAQAAKAVSRGKNISRKTLDKIAKLLQDKDQTLRALLDNPKQAGQILNALQKDGVIQKTNANVYWDSKTTPKIKDFGDPGRGRITQQGKLLVESSLLGAVLPDFGLLQVSPPWLLNVLGRNLDHLGRLKARGGAWDLSQDLLQAVDMVLAAEASPKAVDQLRQYISQQALPGMEQEHSHGARAKALALALVENKPNAFREKLKALAQAAGRDVEGQESMFGTLSADDAFYQQFGRVESLGQPLNPGVDLNARVTIVETPVVFGPSSDGLALRNKFPKDIRNRNLTDQEGIENQHTGDMLHITGNSFDHLVSSYQPKTDGPPHAFFNAVANLKILAEKAYRAESAPDEHGQAGVRGYHYYYAPMALDGELFAVKLEIKEHDGGYLGFDTKAVDRVYAQKISKKMPVGISQEYAAQQTGTPGPLTGTDITVADLLAGIKDRNGKHYLPARPGDVFFQSLGQGVFGPIFPEFSGQPQKAIEKLLREKTGEVPAAMHHPEIGDIDFVYGKPGDPAKKYAGGYGLAHIKAKHPDALINLVEILSTGVVDRSTESLGRIYINTKNEKAVIRLDWDGLNKTWLVTAYAPDIRMSPRADRTSDIVDSSGEMEIPSPDGEPNNNLTISKHKDKYKKLFQSVHIPHRGAVHFLPDGRAVIQLFKSANPSTLVHELGHVFRRSLEELALMPDAPERVQKDWQAMAAFVGADPKGPWSIEQEETLARAFEAYVREGKAPAPGLRGVFETFRRWLVDLYKSVRSLDVELNDDIRGVFDRMLATDTEISRARAEAGVQPFLAIDDIPLSERPGYDDLVQAARAAAAENVTQHRLAEYQKSLAGWRKEGRELANSHEGQQALDELMKAGGISTESLEEAADAETVKQVRRKRVGLVKRGAPHVWELAGTLGMTERELLDLILSTPTKAEIIDQHIKQQAARHEAEAEPFELALSKEYEALLEKETELLEKKAGANLVKPFKAVFNAKDVSVGDLEALNWQDLKADYKRVSKLVLDAYKGGKVEEAARLKRLQAQKVKKLRLASQARREARQAKRYLNRVARFKPQSLDLKGGIDEAFLQQIKALVGRYAGLPKTVQARRDTPSLAEFIADLPPESRPPIDPDLVDQVQGWNQADIQDKALFKKDGAKRKRPLSPINALTLPQLKELKEAVEVLEHMGRQEKQWVAKGRKMAMDQAVAKVINAIRTNYTEKMTVAAQDEGVTVGETPWQGAKRGFREVSALLELPEFIIRKLDLYQDMGPIWDMIFKPINDCSNAEQKMSARAAKEIKALYEAAPKDIRKKWTKKISIEGINQMLTGQEIFCAALNMGNAGNLEALSQGYGWEDKQIEALKDSLFKEEWELVQGMWDHIDQYFATIDEVHYQLFGRHIEKVIPETVVTKYGTYRGGYYPLSFDERKSRKIKEFKTLDAALDAVGEHEFQIPFVRRGFTMKRTGGKKPVLLDLSVFSGHVAGAIHFITHAQATKSTHKLLSDDQVRGHIEIAVGEARYKQLTSWLVGVARPERIMVDPLEKWLKAFNDNTAVAALSFNFMTAAKQPLALFQGMARVGVMPVIKALAHFATHPLQVWELVRSSSDYMANRQNSLDRDIRKAIQKEWGAPGNTSQKVMKQWGLALTGFMEGITASTVWLAAYNQGLSRYKGDTTKAIDFADMQVRNTQGSGLAKDLPKILRGNEWQRTLTMFYTFFASTHNLMREEAGMLSAAHYKPKAVMRFMTSMALIWIIPAILEGMANDRERWEWKNALWDVLYYPLATIPVVREFIPAAKGLNFGTGTIGGAFSQVARIGRTAGARNPDYSKMVDPALRFIGTLPLQRWGVPGYAGLPSNALITVKQGVEDLITGETDMPEGLQFLFYKKREK